MSLSSFQSKKYPILVTTKPILFPNRRIPILVKRTKGLAALEEALKNDKYIIVVPTKSGATDFENPESFFNVGVLAKVEHAKGSPENGFQTLIRAEERVFLSGFELFNTENLDGHSFYKAEISAQLSEEFKSNNQKLDSKLFSTQKNQIISVLNKIFSNFPTDSLEQRKFLEQAESLEQIVYFALEQVQMPNADKLSVLSEPSLEHQIQSLISKLVNYLNTLSDENEGHEKHKPISSSKETLLREKLDTPKQEDAQEESDLSLLERTFSEFNLTPEVRSVVNSELKKLKNLSPMSPDAHVTKTYLETLSQMPWNDENDTEINLEKAKEILNQQHFGLDQVKTRIIEHLAIIKLKGKSQGTSLILVGPPGVGKTTLASSIAEAMNRKFVRVSLGGVRDESDIRGHRRTYVGAMPGRIIQALKRSKSKRPVMLLDEIDKLGRGYAGDPAAALLEVLDPEQNTTFVDHYLDVPFDLSSVMFIATANSLEGIPAPLLDRLEIISLSGYSQEEKKQIALAHVLGKQFESTGIQPQSVIFTEEIIDHIISGYTRESGVRSLTRKIQGVLRYLAPKIATQEEQNKIIITEEIVESALGAKRFQKETLERNPAPGLVTGLAWTPVGGEILFIEASQMPGHGKMILTGQMGDVMKESAQIAHSLVRMRLQKMLPKMNFDKLDLHIHIPAGAVPKDGPSAGISLSLAIASCLLEKIVDPSLALTGEVSLRGAVLPVGGLKEKLLAARRAGVKKVILSERNRPDIKEIGAEMLSGIEIFYVNQIEEVFLTALNLDFSDVSGFSKNESYLSSVSGQNSQNMVEI
jgi:ATP-dependent Lon protease